MNLGERLKQVRENLGYTQKEMAKAINTNPQTWQVYESGKSVPGGNVLEALARMGFNVNWLLTGEGEMIQGKGGYYFEQFSFEERLFIDVVQAGLETKGIEFPDSRKQAAMAYDLYRMIHDLRKDSLPSVDEIKGMFQAFTLFYEKMIEGDSKFTADDIPKIIEHMIKGRSCRTGGKDE